MTNNQLALLLVLQVATSLAGGKYFVCDNANNPFEGTLFNPCASEEPQSPDTIHHQKQTPELAAADPQNDQQNSGGRAAPIVVDGMVEEDELHEESFTQSATETLPEKPDSLFALACEHTYSTEESKENHPELQKLFALGEKLSVHMGPQKGLEAFLAPIEELVDDGHRGTASSSPPILIFCLSARYYSSTQKARATRTASGMEKRAETDGGETADTVCPYPA